MIFHESGAEKAGHNNNFCAALCSSHAGSHRAVQGAEGLCWNSVAGTKPGAKAEHSSSCRCTRPSLSSGGFAQFPGVTSRGEIQDHCLGPVSAPVPVYTASIKPGIKKHSAQRISIRKPSCAEQHCQLCHLAGTKPLCGWIWWWVWNPGCSLWAPGSDLSPETALGALLPVPCGVSRKTGLWNGQKCVIWAGIEGVTDPCLLCKSAGLIWWIIWFNLPDPCPAPVTALSPRAALGSRALGSGRTRTHSFPPSGGKCCPCPAQPRPGTSEYMNIYIHSLLAAEQPDLSFLLQIQSRETHLVDIAVRVIGF